MKTGRKTLMWAVPVVALLAVGCTKAAPSSQVAAPPPVSPTVHVAVTLATPAPAQSAIVRHAPVDLPPQAVSGDVPFQSPSHNLRCDMNNDPQSGDEVRCDALVHTWGAPASPEYAPCGASYDRIGIENGLGQFECRTSDQSVLPEGQVLPYGQSLIDGTILCTSSESGVKCVSQATGHGFTISRETYSLF
jgi:hypothetical protein